MRFLFLAGWMAGWPVLGGMTITPSDWYTLVKFAKTATLWSVSCFLNVELPVDISFLDRSCPQMEALLRKRTAHLDLQRMTFCTTALAARRVCATVEDWQH